MAWQDSLKTISERAKAAFGKLSVRQRWVAGGVGAALFALVFCLVFFTAREGGKVPLQSPVRDLAQARVELQKYAIESDFNTDKSDLMVAREKRDRALIILNAAKLLPDGLPNYAFLGQADFTSTEPQRFERIRVQIEDLLRATITAMDGIRQASVRITPASREVLFKPGSGRNKAAVTVGLLGQERLSHPQVVSIANLVSASYPNLAAEDVFIADTSGRPYSIAADMQATSDRYELRRRIEADKEQAALKALAGLDAIVAATVEVALIDERTARSTDFQPDGAEPVIAHRETTTEKRTTADPRGPAGIRSESGSSNRTDNVGRTVGVEDRKEQLERAAVDENFRSELERMKLVIDYGLSSLAISLPESSAADDKAQAALGAKARNLAMRATGVPTDRIAVEFTPRLAADPREDWFSALLGPRGTLTPWLPMLGSGVLLIVLIAAFLLIFGMLRSAPRTVTAQKAATLAGTLETMPVNTEANQIFERVNELAKDNPAAAANIVRRWMLFNE